MTYEFSRSNGAAEPVADCRPHLGDPPAVNAASTLLTWLQDVLLGNRSAEKKVSTLTLNTNICHLSICWIYAIGVHVRLAVL